MGVYYVLLRISNHLLILSFTFRSWANAVRNVWLIGDNLYGWLIDISVNLQEVVIQFNSFANEWYRFYINLPQSFTIPAILQSLIYWADDIISIVRYFDDWVIDVLKRRSPSIWQLATNPLGYILGLIAQGTGLTLSFFYNPESYIYNIVQRVLGSASAFLANPFGFVIGVIAQAYPVGRQLLQDPDNYITQRVHTLFPGLFEFMQDPDGYIIARIQKAVDTRLASVSIIAQNIATKILSHIW